MKVTPVVGPLIIQPTNEAAKVAKAVAAFNAGQSSYDKPQAQETPVANPNRISPEEISAIKAPSKESPLEVQADAPEAVESEKVTDPEVEKRFKQIAQKERALRAKIHQENQRLKVREEALKAKEAQYSQPQQPDLTQYIHRDKVKADPLTALEEAQVSWDELTQQAINRQPTDPRVTNHINKLQQQIQQLEEQNKLNQQASQQQQQTTYQAAIKQITNDVRQLVNSDPEFETVKKTNNTKEVVKLIEKVYARDGIALSVEEAAKEVENYLIEEALKVTQIDKIKKRIEAANASRAKTDEKTPATKEQTQSTKTLTNAMSSARKPSAKERAIARANGFTGDF